MKLKVSLPQLNCQIYVGRKFIRVTYACLPLHHPPIVGGVGVEPTYRVLQTEVTLISLPNNFNVQRLEEKNDKSVFIASKYLLSHYLYATYTTCATWCQEANVDTERIELSTLRLQSVCTTVVLRAHIGKR